MVCCTENTIFVTNLIKMKLHKLLLFVFFIISTCYLHAQSEQLPMLQKHMVYLASEALEGRFPGTKTDRLTAEYILASMLDNGLTPLYDGGMQHFSVTTSVTASPNNSFNLNGNTLTFTADYSLYSFSSNATAVGEIVFGGFGMVIQSDNLQHNDYEGLDVKDKWVLVLSGDPEPESANSPYIAHAEARLKALHARDRGALGIIFTAGKANNPNGDLAPLSFGRSVVSAGLPVLDLKRSAADTWLSGLGLSVDSLEKQMMRRAKPTDFSIQGRASITTELIRNEVNTFNVVALLPGTDPRLAKEYIIIGAHYDHLGFGGLGSGSRVPDTISVHYGADDNASGVAGVLALASQIAKGGGLKRSVIFAAFGAEEMGLLGSRYMARNLLVDKSSVSAMINLDMIGRLNDKRAVMVGGTGTAAESETILREIEAEHSLALNFSPEGFGASDHASFYAESIPVFFITTGAHPDYHTPADTYDKINFEGMDEVLNMVNDLATKLGNLDAKLTFQEAGPRERSTSRRGFRVTLGIMPDFTDSSNNGLLVGGVTKGGPADGAGIKKGDVITGIEGMAVSTIYDYMNRLRMLKSGQRVNVDINRQGEMLVLIVEL